LPSFGQNYTRQACDPAFSRTAEEEIFYLCDGKSVHKTKKNDDAWLSSVVTRYELLTVF